MKKLTLIILSLLFISIYGCAKRQTQYDSYQYDSYKAPEKPKPKYDVYVKRDDFKKQTEFTGDFTYDPNAAALLRAWKYDAYPNREAIIQLYVSATNFFRDGNVYNFEIAHDLDGKRFEIDFINRRVKECSQYSCYLEENIGIPIAKQYLENYKDKEMKFQVSGRGGKIVITIPAEYTRKFLDAVK